MCDRNFFSEGALGPSQLSAAKASIARVPAGPAGRPLTGHKSSSPVQQPANSTAGATAPVPAAPPKSSSQVQQQPRAPTGAPPPAPAPAAPVTPAAPSLLPPSLANLQQGLRQQGGVSKASQPLDSAAAAAAAAAVVRTRQQGAAQAVSTASVVRPQQVNPVFSTPTYYPCTFCGPGCTTDGPGATSPQQCSKCRRHPSECSRLQLHVLRPRHVGRPLEASSRSS